MARKMEIDHSESLCVNITLSDNFAIQAISFDTAAAAAAFSFMLRNCNVDWNKKLWENELILKFISLTTASEAQN